jgi:hypothetical protein
MLRLAGDTDSFLITDDAGESTLNKVAAQADATARKMLLRRPAACFREYPLQALIAACWPVQG